METHLIALFCLGFGIFFLYLARRGWLRRRQWRCARRHIATVAKLQFRFVFEEPLFISNDKSTARATLQFTDRGQPARVDYTFATLTEAPLCRGDRLRIAYDPLTGALMPTRDLRPWWPLQLFLGVVLAALGFVLLAAGPTVLAQMSAYTVDDPNPVGTLVMAAVGLTMLLFGLAFAAAMVPLCLKPVFAPFLWAVRYALGRLEALDAEYIGSVVVSHDESNSLYPVFSVETPEGAVGWRAPNEYTDAPFDNLRPYTVYRDRRGRFCLEPRLRDFFTIVFAVLPILFLGLCAAVFAFGGFAILLGLAGVF